jgi:hypothetical protein
MRIAASIAVALGCLLLWLTPTVQAEGEAESTGEARGEADAASEAKGEPTEQARPMPVFDVTYDARLVASEKSVHVTIRLGSNASPVEWLRFRVDPMRYRAFEADGELIEIEGGWEWRPPRGGGELRYVFTIEHLRGDNTYDARSTKTWAIFRGEDLVPRVRIRTVPIARSDSRLRLRLPEGWIAALPYRRTATGDYDLSEPRTRFDRPSGWFAFGRLGIVRETIEDVRVAIAGPAGQGIRRMDLLALLSWTLPSIREVFETLPKRLLVVSAGDPMWRGGLSGPRSVYLHADRPLIELDETSPLLHEVMHSFMRARAGEDGDWIVEGLAELYSVSLLRRSGTLSERRFESALDGLRERARDAGPLRVASVDGDTRARAAIVLLELDETIREATADERNLDHVVRRLARQREAITTDLFQRLAQEEAGRDLRAFFDRHAPLLKKSR